MQLVRVLTMPTAIKIGAGTLKVVNKEELEGYLSGFDESKYHHVTEPIES